jgi:hypothetical protein
VKEKYKKGHLTSLTELLMSFINDVLMDTDKPTMLPNGAPPTQFRQ